MITILLSAVTAFVGYVFGRAKTFIEGKQRAYEEILPIVLKAAYNPAIKDEEGVNKALSKLWLYGSRKVAKKMDYAVSIMVKPSRGDKTKALQEAVVEMRNDIQAFFFWQRVEPEEVKHLYARMQLFSWMSTIRM
jgi:hypothetical protein